MSNRFDLALLSQSACNPPGLARSLVAWCDEISAEGGNTYKVCTDPAVRLLTYQLAHLMSVTGSFDYSALLAECERRAKEALAADVRQPQNEYRYPETPAYPRSKD